MGTKTVTIEIPEAIWHKIKAETLTFRDPPTVEQWITERIIDDVANA